MSDSPSVPVTVEIMGNEYRVSCPVDEREALLLAAEYLNEKMRDIREATKAVGGERVAVMAALNIANELLQERQQHQRAGETAQQRLRALTQRLDSALAAVNVSVELAKN